MQRELRDLLERKVAYGGDYYFDMSGDQGGNEYLDMAAGNLVAGARKRRRVKRKGQPAKGSAAAKRKMAKVRAARRGGDFYDANDFGGDFYDVNDYVGGAKKGRRRRAARAKTGNFRNPIEQVERDLYKQQKTSQWLMTDGPEYAAKLQRKAAMINQALQRTGMRNVGVRYNDYYNNQLANLSALAPYQKAARRQGFKVAAPNVPADNNPQRAAYVEAVTAARNLNNVYAPIADVDLDHDANFQYLY